MLRRLVARWRQIGAIPTWQETAAWGWWRWRRRHRARGAAMSAMRVQQVSEAATGWPRRHPRHCGRKGAQRVSTAAASDSLAGASRRSLLDPRVRPEDVERIAVVVRAERATDRARTAEMYR